MSALYFSISRDQASSFPERHSFTSRVSLHAAGGFFSALVITGLIGRHSPAHSGSKAARRSKERTVRERPGGNCRLRSSRPPKCPGSPEKSSVVLRQELPAPGHRVFCVHCISLPRAAAPSAGRSPPPTVWRDAPVMVSTGEFLRSKAIR